MATGDKCMKCSVPDRVEYKPAKKKMDGASKFLYFVCWPPCIVGAIWFGYVVLKDVLAEA